jgi:hypothetical protein
LNESTNGAGQASIINQYERALEMVGKKGLTFFRCPGCNRIGRAELTRSSSKVLAKVTDCAVRVCKLALDSPFLRGGGELRGPY